MEREKEKEKEKAKGDTQRQTAPDKSRVSSMAATTGKNVVVVESENNQKKEESKESMGEEDQEKGTSTSQLLLLLKDLDPELFKSLTWMLENDITDIVYEKFSVVTRVVSPSMRQKEEKAKKGCGEARATRDVAVDKHDDKDKENGLQVQYKYQEVSLCPNGKNIDVTNENKDKYVRLLVRWKTHYAVSAVLDPFLQGFYEVIPLSLLRESEIT